jgi:hypothetical protein
MQLEVAHATYELLRSGALQFFFLENGNKFFRNDHEPIQMVSLHRIVRDSLTFFTFFGRITLRTTALQLNVQTSRAVYQDREKRAMKVPYK